MEQLNIKENTLKFHNKNIYGKLGVSSRKQLIATYSDLNRE
jgi:DNA-binding CsgD family transcriptional regulator